MTGLFGIYRPLRTPLHLTPAWAKIAGLFAAAVAAAWLSGPRPAAAILCVGIVALASTRPLLAPTLRGLTGVVLICVALIAYHWWRSDVAVGAEFAAEFLGLVMLSLALTASTPLDEVLDLVTAAARPVHRWISAETIGLMFALMLRGIPEVTRLMGESHAAARARGVQRDPRAMLIPSAIRTVGYALQVGDAITARGLADADA